MKRGPLIILLIVIIALLTFILIWGIVRPPGGWGFRLGSWRGNADMKTVSNYSANAGEVDKVVLSCVMEDVELMTGSGDQIEVEQTSPDENIPENRKMRCGIDGNTLVIEGAKTNTGISCHSTGYYSTIVVRLPKGYAPVLDCSTASGDVDAKDLSFQSGSISTVSGEVRVQGISFRTGSNSISTTSGDVVAQNVSFNGAPASISTTSGEILLTDVDGGEMTIDSTSGDVRLEKGTFDTLGIDTLSGEIGAEARTAGDVRFETTSGGMHYEGSCRTLNCSSSSGSVWTRVTDLEQLEADTTSGDVDVQFSSANGLRSVDVSTMSGSVAIRLPKGTSINPQFDSLSGDMHIDPGSSFSIGDGKDSIELVVDTASGSLEIRGN